jgi:hypothetical protein
MGKSKGGRDAKRDFVGFMLPGGWSFSGLMRVRAAEDNQDRV